MTPRADCRPLPASISGRPFAAAKALEVGVTPSRLRGNDLKRVFHGVVAPVDWGVDSLALARAFAVKMLPTQCFSHATAAVLHGMRLPRAVQQSRLLHVMTEGGGRSIRGKNIVGHVGRSATTLHEGLRLATPLAAWCQLAATFSVDDLVVAGDGLVSRQNPTVTMAEMLDAVDERQGSRGYSKLKEAIAYVRPNSDSAPETILRLLLVRAGLPEPMVNVPIHNREGKVTAHADLAFPEFRIVLEYDGDQHRTNPDQYYIDIDRLQRIMREGWHVIRVNRRHMQEKQHVIRLVREALADAGWSSPKRGRKRLSVSDSSSRSGSR